MHSGLGMVTKRLAPELSLTGTTLRYPTVPQMAMSPRMWRGSSGGVFALERYKWSAQLTVINLTNKYALYNFLSTFSGTHYVTRDISPTRPQCEPSWTWFAHPSSLTVNSDSCNSGGAMLSCRLDFADVAYCLCLAPVQCAMLYLVIGGLGHEASGFGPAGWRRTLLSRMGLTLAGGKFDSH